MKFAVVSDPHEISAQQIVQLYKHSGVAFIASVANAIILAAFLWPVIAAPSLLAWILLVAATNALRFFLARAHLRSHLEVLVQNRWMNRHLVFTAAAGLAWGAAAIVLFPENALPQQVFMILMLGSAATSALPTFAAVPRAYAVYLSCVLAPMALRLAFFEAGDAHAAMAMMVFLYGATLILTARSMHVGLMDSLRLHSGFETLAHLDGLTGIPNRRQFDEMLAQEWNRARRTNAPLTLIMIDVDHFKSYNDRYGHPAGDTCLKQVANTLAKCCRRAGDVVARYGGEEFALLMYHTPRNDGYAHAEQLRQAVAALQIPHDGTAGGYVTISLGAATQVPDANGAPETLLHAADQALYEAKRQGRNHVVLAALH